MDLSLKNITKHFIEVEYNEAAACALGMKMAEVDGTIHECPVKFIEGDISAATYYIVDFGVPALCTLDAFCAAIDDIRLEAGLGLGEDDTLREAICIFHSLKPMAEYYHAISPNN